MRGASNERSRWPTGAKAAAAFAAAMLWCAGASFADERIRFDDDEAAPAANPSPKQPSSSGHATGAGDAPREEASAARDVQSFTSRRVVGMASQSGDEPGEAPAPMAAEKPAAPVEAPRVASPREAVEIDPRFPLSALREVPIRPAPPVARAERHVEAESGAKIRGELRYAPLASDTASGAGDAPGAAPVARRGADAFDGLRFVPSVAAPKAVPASVMKPAPASRERADEQSVSRFAAPGTMPTTEEKLLLDLVNVERSARNLKPVTWNPTLAELARRHSADMLARRTLSHESSTGESLARRLRSSTYKPREAAENVAFHADVVKAHRALMDSKGHRRNILDPALEEIGLGIARDRASDWIYVVQDFATPKRGAY